MIKLLAHTRRPDISFSRNGIIRITARLARILTIHAGDILNISIADGEYLLYASHSPVGRHEAQCYPSNKGSNHYCANSVRLCRSLLDAAGINAPKAAFMAGQPFERDDTTYIPIITLRPL